VGEHVDRMDAVESTGTDGHTVDNPARLALSDRSSYRTDDYCINDLGHDLLL